MRGPASRGPQILSRRDLLCLSSGALMAALMGCREVSEETEPASGGGRSASRPIEGVQRVGVVLPAELDPSVLPVGYLSMVEGARMGVTMAAEESAFNALLHEVEIDVRTETAGNGASARAAAERLLDVDGVFGIIGGFGHDHAVALDRLARERRVPFVNVGALSDSLRGEECSPWTFHVAPSAAMYLDALTGWFIRSGYRRWFYVHDNSEEGGRLLRRARWALDERHFGGREVGSYELAPDSTGFGAVIDSVTASGADVVLLLLEPDQQLAFHRAFGSHRSVAVTGLPHLQSQTREFYAAWGGTPASSARRAAAWEPSLDAYGARELNSRFQARWGRPMDAPAWSAYQGVKILIEAALAAGSTDGSALTDRLENPEAVFDIWKGIGTSFRSWDHQLRQPVYLVEIDGEDAAATRLVGELPAIYMPGTDPVERLDQIGDLERNSLCRF